jgi:hypothetical protein
LELAEEIYDLASLLGACLASPDAESATDGMCWVAHRIRGHADILRNSRELGFQGRLGEDTADSELKEEKS